MKTPQAILSVVVTVLITAYSTHIGAIAILALYALWLPYIYRQNKIIFLPIGNIIIPLALCLLSLMSVFWSNYISITLYASVQYVSTVICAIIIARVMPLETFIKGIALGCLMVLIPTLITGSFSFAGLFGSKNTVGLYAEVGIITSLLLLFFHRERLLSNTTFIILPLIISITCLILSNSATALISTVSILTILLASYFLGKFPSPFRPLLLIWAILGIATCAINIYALQLDILDTVLSSVGKDKTLTGRTDIWEAGIETGTQKPILGTGYAAFWVAGQPVAEQIWHDFHIKNKTGFHFHNLFIQSFVELGILGLACMIILLLSYTLKSIWMIVKDGNNLHSLFFVGLSILFISRTFSEVDIFFPYTLGTFLFFSTFPRVFSNTDTTKEKNLNKKK